MEEEVRPQMTAVGDGHRPIYLISAWAMYDGSEANRCVMMDV